jgi:hypothetical protein
VKNPTACFLAENTGAPLPVGAMWRDGPDWWLQTPAGAWRVDVPMIGEPPAMSLYSETQQVVVRKGWLFQKKA